LISVDLSDVQLQHEIEKDEASFEFTLKDDMYAVSSLLKVRRIVVLMYCGFDQILLVIPAGVA